MRAIIHLLNRLRLGAKDPRGVSLAFQMQVYKDPKLARRAATRVRRFYPDARFTIISDGDPDFPLDDFAEEFSAETAFGDNLYGQENGGRLMHRCMELYLGGPGDYLLRLDSDARIDRAFSYLPRKSGVFGDVNEFGNIQGGCILISRDAAERLHDSEIFLSPKLLSPEESWGRYSRPERLAIRNEQGRVSYEKVLRWGCEEAGVRFYNWREIFSRFKREARFESRFRNADGRYAVVHPDKTMDGLEAPDSVMP